MWIALAPTLTAQSASQYSTALPAGTAAGDPVACVGDCNGNGRVTIDELLTGVDIALTRVPPTSCPSFDANANGRVGLHELGVAVALALAGCDGDLQLGQRCTIGTQCASDFCVDGVCCARPCEPDELCNVPAFEGTCLAAE